jgi:hypothetical protein
MTEVEFPRLLSELTDAAAQLNTESDSINDLISKFESTLSDINLGIEVWASAPLEEVRWTEDDDDGRTMVEGTHDKQLGFAKINDWCLAVRRVSYRKERDGDFTLLDTDGLSSELLHESRAIRIKALTLFPALARAMKERALESIRAIADAKKFVS